jgi:hypothetical protein
MTLEDFTVDLVERKVRHSTGAVIGFHEYPNEELWDTATGHLIESGQFTGSVDDLLSVAKLVARAHGMKCQRPSGTGPADQ